MAEMMKVTGLWANKARDGKTYLSGTLGSMRVLIFPNLYKEEEKHPSHIMYFAPIEPNPNSNTASDEFIDGETGDDFLEAAPARPATTRPATTQAATAPAARQAAPPPQPARQAPSAPTNRPAAGGNARPAARPAPADDFGDDMDDPFADS